MLSLLIAAALSATPPAVPDGASRAIVRLENTAQSVDWRSPWNPGSTSQSTGTGFVIANGRIMTNAHVVAQSKNLVFRFADDATPHQARVVAVAHDCDLAIIEPVEPGLLDAIPPLTFGELPHIGDQVVTMGFPMGGRWLSSTAGVVSRIDYVQSAHSGQSHLAVQTDAAINPGNSGGPVVSGGKVVGVAYQVQSALQSTGFFIPTPVVRHVLDDLTDGTYDGFPSLDVTFEGLDNPAARRAAGLAEGQTGVRVFFVHPAAPAAGVLLPGDVLLTIDGETIRNDGTFSFGDQQLQMWAVLDRFQSGDRVPITVLRDGARVELAVPVGASRYPDRAFERLPRYYVYAGLVFVELGEYLANTGDIPPEDVLAVIHAQFASPAKPLPERIVVLRRLDHAVNATASTSPMALIERVNGQEVHSLEALIANLGGNTEPWQVFEFTWGGGIAVLDRGAADAANAEILKQYGVFEDRRL